ncbi:hypothetical protein AQ623_12105 [Flavobacterium columnare]|nr:hypothetical protein AQ623_12105 [Flavobacterium columnare]
MGYAQQTITDYNTMEPIVTKNFEKFDKKYYDELKIKYNDVSFTIYLKDNSYLELTDSSYRLTVPNSYFTLTKGYYKNGNIKIKGSALNNNSHVNFPQLATFKTKEFQSIILNFSC